MCKHASFVEGELETDSKPSSRSFPSAATADTSSTSEIEAPRELPDGVDSLKDLEHQVNQSPTLCRIWSEYQSALAKIGHIGRLPDPKIAANVFGQPIETAAGSQQANLTVSQVLPWLSRLDARTQQAAFAAAAVSQTYASERIKLIAEVRTYWYRIYVLKKQIEINVANQELLTTLINVATSRVSTGQASQSDVLSATLEYSKLEERLVTLRQQLVSTKARINRVIGRDVETQIEGPSELLVSLPDWDQTMLRSLTWLHQPEIEAARIRKHAARWGVEVARLERRPDFTLNASWFAIEDNRPSTSIVDVGRDAWALGAMMTIPTHGEKYAAMEQEALWKQAASASSIEEVRQRFESVLVDVWEQACAADETVHLYQVTIIPDAKRAFETDLKAYSNGDIDFDRVMRDFRNLLTLELGYHRSLGQLAIALARIWQTTGGSVGLSSDVRQP